MWAPSSRPVLASKIVLTSPRLAERDGLAVAEKGKRPTLTLVPAAFAFSSVRPTEAICGLAIGAAGDLPLVERMTDRAPRSPRRRARPRARPCERASAGRRHRRWRRRPAHSSGRGRRSSRSRARSSTPSASSPRFSTLPTTPTAEMHALDFDLLASRRPRLISVAVTLSAPFSAP